MFEKFSFCVRFSLLILLLSILFFIGQSIFVSVLKTQSIPVAEKILPSLNNAMPISCIVKEMRSKQYHDACQTLKSNCNQDYSILTITSDFLSIGLPHAVITFSKSENFYPVFRISVQQLKQIKTLVEFLYLIFCMMIIVVPFGLHIYKNSNMVLLLYLYLLILGILWFSSPCNPLSFRDDLFCNKNQDIGWTAIPLDNGLILQWREQQPFIYLYKSDSLSEVYFKQYNPHANWHKVGTDLWLCRYDSILELINRIHILN